MTDSKQPSTDLVSSGSNPPSDPFDAGVVKLAAQAAFLQAFAEGIADAAEERPVEELLAERPGGELDFGWRAGLRL